MIEPDEGCIVYQAWKEYDHDNLKVGDVVEDIIIPDAGAALNEYYFVRRWRFRLWRAKVQKTSGPFPNAWREIDYGIPEIYIIRPDDERVIDYIKTTFMPYESEL